MKPKYLIVGQGLAGTAMALNLLKRDIFFLLIDNGHKTAASKAATGIYNPLIFRRLVLGWNAPLLIPHAEKWYSEAERTLGGRFLFPSDLYRIITSPEEAEAWRHKASEPFFSDFMDPDIIAHDKSDGGLQAAYGFGKVRGGGRIDAAKFISLARDFFSERGMLMEQGVDYTAFDIRADEVSYGEVKAEAAIFCEGYKMSDNPFFNYLPLNPAKGEELCITSAEAITDKIVNRGIFLVPTGGNNYMAGATYSWSDLDETPSASAEAWIRGGLSKMTETPYSITEHKAGVRPATIDRRPFIGTHPKYKSVHIFNGMGAKGVSLAPYYSDRLIDHLEIGIPLDPEADIRRFEEKYYKA